MEARWDRAACLLVIRDLQDVQKTTCIQWTTTTAMITAQHQHTTRSWWAFPSSEPIDSTWTLPPKTTFTVLYTWLPEYFVCSLDSWVGLLVHERQLLHGTRSNGMTEATESKRFSLRCLWPQGKSWNMAEHAQTGKNQPLISSWSMIKCRACRFSCKMAHLARYLENRKKKKIGNLGILTSESNPRKPVHVKISKLRTSCESLRSVRVEILNTHRRVPVSSLWTVLRGPDKKGKLIKQTEKGMRSHPMNICRWVVCWSQISWPSSTPPRFIGDSPSVNQTVHSSAMGHRRHSTSVLILSSVLTNCLHHAPQ